MSESITIIKGYDHQVASHCETGSVRNLLHFAGLEMSEPMIFGIGSGPLFYYLFFAKGPSTFPLVGIRVRPATIVKNVRKLCGLDFSLKQYPTTQQAMNRAHQLIDAGIPVAISVDMFRMKYLPSFLRVHAPFHFIVLVGYDKNSYAISDPYTKDIGILSREDLEAAWETHAPLAQDNLICYLRTPPEPEAINWQRAIVKALRRTCRAMILPPLVRHAFPFIGVEGMRMYARKMRAWPDRYQGSTLRDGMIFNAIAFEDQGTGGAAFRLMYGAFLDEASTQLNCPALHELAARMIEHGRQWRSTSRAIVLLARDIPLNDSEYTAWRTQNGAVFKQGLAEISQRFSGFADVEGKFFRDLQRVAAELG